MKTKIVYIVISDNSDIYLEQALISVYSLRKYNPDAYVELVVDTDTNKTIVNERARIKKYVTKITPVDVPAELTKKQRSRFIKTSLRNLVEGNYLFIDTDTIICTSLEKIDNITDDICATKDNNKTSHLTLQKSLEYRLAQKANLENELWNEPYFNSGVMYVKDTTKTHEMYNTWHNCWKKTLEKGVDSDQTSLCWANKLSKHVIKHMDDVWNCQIALGGTHIAKNAKIIHYFNEYKKSRYILTSDSLFTTLKETDNVSQIIEEIINQSKSFLIEPDTEIFLRNAVYLKLIFEKYPIFFKFIQWQCMHFWGLLTRLHIHRN